MSSAAFRIRYEIIPLFVSKLGPVKKIVIPGLILCYTLLMNQGQLESLRTLNNTHCQ
jgi:hypothetical protein